MKAGQYEQCNALHYDDSGHYVWTPTTVADLITDGINSLALSHPVHLANQGLGQWISTWEPCFLKSYGLMETSGWSEE